MVLGGAGKAGHRRAEAEPRVADREQRALRVPAARGEVGDAADQHRGRDQERHGPRRQQEQHRDEHELRRDRPARADRALDAGEDRGVALRPPVLHHDSGESVRLDGEQLHHRRLASDKNDPIPLTR